MVAPRMGLWYRRLARPLLFRMDPEHAHECAVRALAFASSPLLAPVRAWLRACSRSGGAGAPVRLFGVDFPNRVGIAAGFDKNAVGWPALLALGYGHVEVGTVTLHAQPGNPRPRMFRYPAEAAVINRMGFNNEGAAKVAERLQGSRSTIVGVNIGKTKLVADEDAVSDYVKSAELLGAFADYVVVNVSSPNTPGLRALQSVERLRPLLSAVQATLARVKPGAPPPLLVKIAPDLSDEAVDEIGDMALELGLSGIIATNTTTSREGLATPAHSVQKLGPGGLSGAPVRLRSLSVLKRLRRRVGDRMVLIAAGGIETADDAWERIRAGASLVQVYTGFVYEGPLLAHRIAQGLVERVRGMGFQSIQAAVGTAPDRPSLAPPLSASSSAVTSSV